MVSKTTDTNEQTEQELAAIPSGRQVRLIRIAAGLSLKERLAAMGLIPQGIIRVIRNEGQGQVIVEIRGARVILGRGMSGKIRVRSLE